jgi:hypothetical protein
MPETPVSSLAKTNATVSSPGKTATRDSGEVKTEAPAPTPAKSSLLTIGLGALAGILFIIVVVLWIKVGALNTTIVESQNRIEQDGSATAAMQAQVDGAKANQLNSLVDKTKAGAAKLQTQLDASRANSAALQAKLEKAEKEIAQLKTTRPQK